MLSVEELRESLGRPDLTDDQIGEMRDTLQCLARTFVEAYLRGQRRDNLPPAT